MFTVGLHNVDVPVPTLVMGTSALFTAPGASDKVSAGVFTVESPSLKMQLENMTALVFMMCQHKKMHRTIFSGVGRRDGE